MIYKVFFSQVVAPELKEMWAKFVTPSKHCAQSLHEEENGMHPSVGNAYKFIHHGKFTPNGSDRNYFKNNYFFENGDLIGLSCFYFFDSVITYQYLCLSVLHRARIF
jgi:hypothetical protein